MSPSAVLQSLIGKGKETIVGIAFVIVVNRCPPLSLPRSIGLVSTCHLDDNNTVADSGKIENQPATLKVSNTKPPRPSL